MADDMLRRYRDFYEEDGDPRHVQAALFYCWQNNVAPPEWLFWGAYDALEPLRDVAPEGRGSISPRRREDQEKVDLDRGWIIWRLRREGVSRREVFQEAANRHGGTASRYEYSWKKIKNCFPPVK